MEIQKGYPAKESCYNMRVEKIPVAIPFRFGNHNRGLEPGMMNQSSSSTCKTVVLSSLIWAR